MMNTAIRPWLIGAWFATIAVVVAVSVAMEANLSTTVLLLALGVTPAIVVGFMSGGVPTPTVAEILHNVDSKAGGR